MRSKVAFSNTALPLRTAQTRWKLLLPTTSPRPNLTNPSKRHHEKSAATFICIAQSQHFRTIANVDHTDNKTSAASIAQTLISEHALDKLDHAPFQSLTDSRAALFTRVLANRTRHLTVVLDGVWGAHNLAAIARSCDAWGIQDLHVIAEPDEYIPKGRKGRNDRVTPSQSLLDRFDTQQSLKSVSKNSHKWLTISEYHSVRPCLTHLKDAGYKVAVSSLSKHSKPIYELDLSEKCAFVFGNEKHGVTKEMEEHADVLFTVPMFGFVESMNVSVAVGTTISLASTKCRQLVHEDDFNLSPPEKRKLAHSWLTSRVKKEAPKVVSGRQDVTKLGYVCERKIVREGMFKSASNDGGSQQEIWHRTLRLSGDGGSRLETYVKRRKIGALGDREFTRRGSTIEYFVSGAHALSCEAAIHPSGSFGVSRESLVKYFAQVCRETNMHYAKYFDSFGVPTLPIFAAESSDIMRGLREEVGRIAWEKCVELAKDIAGKSEDELVETVRRANIKSVARCISDTLRCGEEEAGILKKVAGSCKVLTEPIVGIVQERDRTRDVILSSGLDDLSDENGRESQSDVDLLQVCLRLMHAGFLCSEVHQTVWDRHVDSSDVGRIQCVRFGVMESILCDSFAEMELLKRPEEESLFRMIFEWNETLHSLKQVAYRQRLK